LVKARFCPFVLTGLAQGLNVKMRQMIKITAMPPGVVNKSTLNRRNYVKHKITATELDVGQCTKSEQMRWAVSVTNIKM
jgi:hypothetical protein